MEKRKYEQLEDDSNFSNKHINIERDKETGQDVEDSEQDIKQFSSEQRLAQSDEPCCIVCGKYGEYINDDTDHDVCSLQCKAINTDLNYHRLKRKKITEPIIIRHIHDYVAENVHAKLTNYQEPHSIASFQQTEQMLRAHDVQVKGRNVPKPFSTYDQLEHVLGKKLLDNIESLGWSMATGIQRQAVTVGLAGRDLLAIAPTHSGKTGAFLIPMIVHCMSLSAVDAYKRRAGPYAMIMAPTRELCLQIEAVCKRLAEGIPNLRTGLLIGGEPLPTQIHRIKKGIQIMIGTPGRVLDIATHHSKLLRIWKIRMLVLDEADAMFKMGFGAQVRQILGKLPNDTVRQTSYFSATMTEDSVVHTLYKKLKSPVEIRVHQPAKDEKESQLPETSDQVRQTVLWVDNKSKSKRLFSILRNPTYFVIPILIFVASRLGAEFLTRAIKKKAPHLRVMSMHADKTQEERATIVQGINQTEPLWDIIVSTDILSRGVDLPAVKLVINYDMAATLDDYVHRIGRAVLTRPPPSHIKQQRGRAITFINQEHQYLLETFAIMLSRKSPAQVTPLPAQLKRYVS
ncbi:P-loop containing nucleoside triphosphate hydrolase protein [Blakeslea trispora]|nr:P-loop containing nucleoside triphosphate hydrolase protein [Blakeslea trispora]